MRYIWESGKPDRVMHIERFTLTGEETMEALCGIRHSFNRSINAPFGLGRRICRDCMKKADDLTKRGGAS